MDSHLIKRLRLASNLLLLATLFLVLLVGTIPFIVTGKLDLSNYFTRNSKNKEIKISDYFSQSPKISTLTNSDEDRRVKYGYQLISETFKYIGPKSEKPYAGNNLACKNCHLDAGTRKFSAPFIGVTQRFPQFRGREGKEGTIEERINGCMERSMNGNKLAEESEEMKAMVAYMEWLGQDMDPEFSKNELTGRGFVKIEIPNRKVDLEHGQLVYVQKCQSCHMENGEGSKNPGGGYTFPPLWGDDTYNHGAGMHRVLTAAQFIKGNMPFGATYNNPLLSDEEAFDVAGYINSFTRPNKPNTEVDFPDKKLKPISTPYPPFADNFPTEQHKYGPFPEMIKFYQTQYDITKTK